MINKSYQAIMLKKRLQLIGFKLSPKKLTIKQLHKIYENFYQKKLDRLNRHNVADDSREFEILDNQLKDTSKSGLIYILLIKVNINEEQRKEQVKL